MSKEILNIKLFDKLYCIFRTVNYTYSVTIKKETSSMQTDYF